MEKKKLQTKTIKAEDTKVGAFLLRYKPYETALSILTWEIIVAALFMVLSGEAFEFFRCGLNWPCLYQHSFLITAFLAIMCNSLAIYGFLSSRMFFVNFGIIPRITAGLYYFLLTILLIIQVNLDGNIRDTMEKDGSSLMILIGFDMWILVTTIKIWIQIKKPLTNPKPMSSTQSV